MWLYDVRPLLYIFYTVHICTWIFLKSGSESIVCRDRSNRTVIDYTTTFKKDILSIYNMSRLRTDLKPVQPSRRSATKFPPVKVNWGSHSPTLNGQARDPEWSTDMIRGIQLKTMSKGPILTSMSPRKTPMQELTKVSSSVHQEERRSSTTEQNSKDKVIEVRTQLFALSFNDRFVLFS